jgi:hypothetical protein
VVDKQPQNLNYNQEVADGSTSTAFESREYIDEAGYSSPFVGAVVACHELCSWAGEGTMSIWILNLLSFNRWSFTVLLSAQRIFVTTTYFPIT